MTSDQTWHRTGLKRRYLMTMGVSAAAAAAVVACGPAPAAGPQTGTGDKKDSAAEPGKPVRGGTYTEAGIGDGKTMQPLLSQDTASSGYINNHYNAPLMRRNPETFDWDTKYGTAESFNISPDSLTITFKLKPNIFWSDGKPISAQDYKFTFDKMMDPKVDFPYKSNYKLFTDVSAPDDRTLVFKLNEVNCPGLDRTSLPGPIPKHIFENLDINDNPLNQQPTVGSGPWLLQEWVKDDHATFVANDKFYLGRPNFDKYITRVVADQNVVYAMLKAGEVDLASVKAEDWDEAKGLKHLQPFNYYRGDTSSWTYIGTNMRNEILKDIRVRQAITYALDRQKIVDRIRLGHARPMHTIYSPASWMFTDDVPKYGFDVNKAKSLLDDAGWKVPASGGTRVKDSKPLKMRIFYNAGNKEREGIATIAQQYAKDIGMELEVISEEWNAYLNRVGKTRDMELYVLGWSAGQLEPDSSKNIYMTDGGQNDMGYSNAKVDDLFPKGAVVPGCKQEDRKKIYSEIERQISADAPYIFLWENEFLTGVNNRIEVNKLTKAGFGYRQWEWYAKPGK